jgi:hypothetical protein
MANAAALRQRVIRYGQDVFSEALDLMVEALREAAPVGEDRADGGAFGTHPPGDTRRGIEAIDGGTETRPAGTLRSATPQGEWVERGTEPHRIEPRTPGGVLAFRGGRGVISQPRPNSRIATRQGGTVFAKHVNHPGQPARPWFGPVVERFPEFLRRAAARVVG